jgi:hypothetical protein
MFHRRITTSIVIDAPPRKVWGVLMDFPSYGDWNPFIRRISGPAAMGSWLEVEIAPPGMSVQTFRPTVTICQADRVFVWQGALGVPGLFSGTHRFELTPGGLGTRFEHSESFAGVLVPVTGKVLEATHAGFKAMNLALKARCEGL